jgi:hypothetical protein
MDIELVDNLSQRLKSVFVEGSSVRDEAFWERSVCESWLATGFAR